MPPRRVLDTIRHGDRAIGDRVMGQWIRSARCFGLGRCGSVAPRPSPCPSRRSPFEPRCRRRCVAAACVGRSLRDRLRVANRLCRRAAVARHIGSLRAMPRASLLPTAGGALHTGRFGAGRGSPGPHAPGRRSRWSREPRSATLHLAIRDLHFAMRSRLQSKPDSRILSRRRWCRHAV